MPHLISITVKVESTPSLRDSYLSGSRRTSAIYMSMDGVGTQNRPLVVVRGCSPIHLDAATNGTAKIEWSVTSCGQPNISLQSVQGPSLASPMGKTNRLSTDAVGDYCVTAWYIDPGSQLKVEATRYFRFVGAQVNFTQSSGDKLYCSARSPTQVDFSARFEFQAAVTLSGGGTSGTEGVDSVRIGVIQNLSGKLNGIYQQDKKAKTGKLIEGSPAGSPPHIDCGDEEEIPFYNVTIDNKSAPVRTIDFEDAPALTAAPFFDPGSMKVVEESEESYRLVGAEGENQFVAAVVAYSKDIKNTYIVLAKMYWTLNVKSQAGRIGEKKWFDWTCTPLGGSGAQKVKEEVLLLPLEAFAAGIETYGPTAVSGGEDSDDDDETNYAKYQWQPT